MKIKQLLVAILSLYFVLTTETRAQTDTKRKHISVAVLTVNKQQIALFSELFSRFNYSQSELTVDVDFFSDQGLKSKFSSWLENGQYDLIHWQAGKRLDDIVKQELLLPIDTLIDRETLKKHVNSQLLEVVNLNGSYQALPFAYYPWGFYYSKSIFDKYAISPPKSWAEFLAICNKLKKLGVAPLVQANQEGWPLLAWVDFLALDNGGTSTRQELTQFANVSRSSVDKIVEQFSTLLDYGYFFAPDHSWRWEQTLILLLREQAAMTLMGQFAESQIEAKHSPEIGFFPFPFKQKVVQPVVAPIDLFVVPLASKNSAFLPALLDYLVKPETNKALATGLGFIPVYPQFDGQGLSERALIGLQSLRDSTELVQYFDRDAESQYATNLANSIAQSILNGESSVFQGALSGQEFIQSTRRTVEFGLPEKWLDFSSFTGSRGTFFASNMLSAVYKTLGYNITVTRYQDIAESLNSYKYGADGELVRAKILNSQSNDLIQVPEPIVETSIYLVCRISDDCTRKLQPNIKVGTTMEVLSLKDWWAQQKVVQQDFKSTASMLQAFESGQLNFMILSAIDMLAYGVSLNSHGYRTILTIPFYHFIHKKHKNMLQEVNQGLIEFKKTAEYLELKSRYWLQ